MLAHLTLFCVDWSLHLEATFLAFKTRAAVVLATALASPSKMSCLSLSATSSSVLLFLAL